MFECQDVCRLCLAENNLGPIFSDTERSERYTTVLSLTTGLKIEPNDGLPQNICEKCTYLVNCALRLRNRSFICDTKLRKQKYRTNNEVQTLLNNVDTFDYNSSEDYNNYSGLKEFNVQIEFDRLTEENQDGFPPKPHEAKEQTVQSKIKNVKGEKVTRKEKRDRYLSLVDGDFDANGPVKCKVCKKSVSKWSCFISHAKLHLGFKFMCEYCGKSFISSTQLKRHCRSYHGMRRELACKHCDYLALDNAQLAVSELHERRVHTGERPFVCDHCGASYYSRRCLVQHLESHRDIGTVQIKMNDGLPQKICTKCIEIMNSALEFRFKSVNAEKRLLGMLSKKKARKIGGAPPVSNQSVGFDYGLYQHEIHNDHDYIKVKHDELMQKFKKKSIQRNPTIITENGTYKCHMCEKEYKNKHTLRAHINFHTNYCVCETCGKRCLSYHLLLAHKRARHGHERVHFCVYCDYSSATKDALVVHERRHTGEKPYICDQCGLAFHRRSNLVQHMAIHLPESNYQCTICNKREKSKRLLQHHEFKVHREKRHRYVCPVCRDVFRSPATVRRHLTRTHAVPRQKQGVIDKFEVQPQATPGEETRPSDVQEVYFLMN